MRAPQYDMSHHPVSASAAGSIIFDNMCVQRDAVTTQTARVQQLQAQAATGKVSVAKLEKEQGILSKMTVCHLLLKSCCPASTQVASTVVCIYVMQLADLQQLLP